MEQEFQFILRYAVSEGRTKPGSQQALHRWFDSVHHMMATYRPDEDDPAEFEHQLLAHSLAELHRQADWQPQQRRASHIGNYRFADKRQR